MDFTDNSQLLEEDYKELFSANGFQQLKAIYISNTNCNFLTLVEAAENQLWFQNIENIQFIKVKGINLESIHRFFNSCNLKDEFNLYLFLKNIYENYYI